MVPCPQSQRPRRKLHNHTWLHGLPFKMRFRRSKLYISALLPLGVGIFVGILAAIMGVGGGFVMVPAMIYLLGMPTSVVVGTSLFQIVFVTANVTFLQSVNNQTVDIVLAMLLVVGSVSWRTDRRAGWREAPRRRSAGRARPDRACGLRTGRVDTGSDARRRVQSRPGGGTDGGRRQPF